VAAGLVGLCLGLSGCGPMIAGMPLVGEPADAQNRPAVQPDYPTAFRQPMDPDAAKPMSAAERAQAQTDLQTARDRAAAERRQQITKPPSRPTD
jgi:hypothetical protein